MSLSRTNTCMQLLQCSKLCQTLQPGPRDGRDVDEHVLAAVARLNEAEALLCVEPFYCTQSHLGPPSIGWRTARDVARGDAVSALGSWRVARGRSSSARSRN